MSRGLLPNVLVEGFRMSVFSGMKLKRLRVPDLGVKCFVCFDALGVGGIGDPNVVPQIVGSLL